MLLEGSARPFQRKRFMPFQIHLDDVYPLKHEALNEVVEAFKHDGLESGGAGCTVDEVTEAVVTGVLVLCDPQRCHARGVRDGDLGHEDVSASFIGRDVAA